MHLVDDYFKAETVEFVKNMGQSVNNSSESVVYFENFDGLIKYVHEKRKVYKVHFKFRFDGVG